MPSADENTVNALVDEIKKAITNSKTGHEVTLTAQHYAKALKLLALHDDPLVRVRVQHIKHFAAIRRQEVMSK